MSELDLLDILASSGGVTVDGGIDADHRVPGADYREQRRGCLNQTRPAESRERTPPLAAAQH